jgi:hypothetical protein
METDSSQDAPQRLPRMELSTAELIYEWLHRAVALACLGFGLMYWIRLIGLHEGTAWRFDLMPMHWQIASVVLAVLFPFAASGLWMLASWGPVIWFLCAAIETAMYLGMPQCFGQGHLIVAAHGAIALAYVVLRVIIHLGRRAQAD